MIKYFIIVCVFGLNIVSCKSQNKSVNLILLVNDKLEVGTFTNARIKLIDKIGDIEIFPVTYYPGELTLSESTISSLNKESTESYFLLIDHNEYCGKEEHIIHNYEIQIYPAWLEQPYMLVRFYNMNYRNLFASLDSEDYTYQVDLASNSILNVKPECQNSNEQFEYIEKFKDLPKCVKKSFRKNSRKHKTFFATTYPDRSSYTFLKGLVRGEKCIVVYTGFGTFHRLITIYNLSDCSINLTGNQRKLIHSAEDFINEAENLKPCGYGLQPSD